MRHLSTFFVSFRDEDIHNVEGNVFDHSTVIRFHARSKTDAIRQVENMFRDDFFSIMNFMPEWDGIRIVDFELENQ